MKTACVKTTWSGDCFGEARFFKCSACGKHLSSYGNDFEVAHYSFCHWCGARLDTSQLQKTIDWLMIYANGYTNKKAPWETKAENERTDTN